MPAIEKAELNQKAVYWPPTGAADDRGNPKVGPAQELDVRWEKTRRQAGDGKSRKANVDAEVAAAVELEDGGIMWEGDMADLPTDLSAITDLYEIIGTRVSPDLKNRFIRYEASLARYKNALPTVEN